jgi:hypothetical protein
MAKLDFDETDPLAWLDATPTYSAKTVKEMLNAGMPVEEIATAWLSSIGPLDNTPFGASTGGQNFFKTSKVSLRNWSVVTPHTNKSETTRLSFSVRTRRYSYQLYPQSLQRISGLPSPF